MIDESNPAGRLYKILSKAKGQPDNRRVKDVWNKALGIDGDDVEVTKSVVELYSLSQEIQSLIKMKENLNHDLYLSSFQSIDRAFFPLHLATNWQSVKQHLTDEALTRLQFCSQELSGFYSEESLSEEDLEDIIKKTDELFTALYSSSLPSALRLALLEEVQRIRNAISLYQIKGAKGLKEALQGAIGALVANQEELKNATDSDDDDVIKRLGNLLDKMDSFTSKALKIHKIMKSPMSFLIEKFTSKNEEQDSEVETANET
ncbi:hypothetical protein ACFSJY_19190 [Thalassotalea euphylliae]|uniref:hypothetical protein n=1 Tax=Thalassotalea euphylliae TaxID=1655234 RepID=UPI00363E78EC